MWRLGNVSMLHASEPVTACGFQPGERGDCNPVPIDQKDRDVPKQVTEKLKIPCQQDQPELAKQQQPTSDAWQLLVTPRALKSTGGSTGGSSRTAPCSHSSLFLKLTSPANHFHAASSFATARTEWYNCKDFVVKTRKTSRTKKNPRASSGAKGCLSPEGTGRWERQGNSWQRSARPVALRRSCALCPYHLPLMAVLHLRVPQSADCLPPAAQTNLQLLSSGSSHRKVDWNVSRAVLVQPEGQCGGEEGRKCRGRNTENSERFAVFVFLTLSRWENCKPPSSPAHLRWTRHGQAPAVPLLLLKSVFISFQRYPAMQPPDTPQKRPPPAAAPC